MLQNMLDELCSGPCMALEIHATDAPRTFREFCGPADPVSNKKVQSCYNVYLFPWGFPQNWKKLFIPTSIALIVSVIFFIYCVYNIWIYNLIITSKSYEGYNIDLMVLLSLGLSDLFYLIYNVICSTLKGFNLYSPVKKPALCLHQPFVMYTTMKVSSCTKD